MEVPGNVLGQVEKPQDGGNCMATSGEEEAMPPPWGVAPPLIQPLWGVALSPTQPLWGVALAPVQLLWGMPSPLIQPPWGKAPVPIQPPLAMALAPTQPLWVEAPATTQPLWGAAPAPVQPRGGVLLPQVAMETCAYNCHTGVGPNKTSLRVLRYQACDTPKSALEPGNTNTKARTPLLL